MISKLSMLAKKTIEAAWLNGPSYDLATQAAEALESAQLLQSPETAAELERLRVELAQRSQDLADTHADREQLRAQITGLKVSAAAHRRQGYDAAIEVMRQEKLPMSVGLLEAQLALDILDGLVSELVVYRASWDTMRLGRYTTETEARKHAEDHARRDLPTASFDWIVDEEDGVAELVATVAGEENPTGYVVTALEIASEYDRDGDE